MALTDKQRTGIVAGITAVVGVVGGAAAENLADNPLLNTDEIVQMQELKRGEGLHFEQILPGGLKPDDAKDKTPLINFPANMRVDVYDGPEGSGYTVVEELPNRIVSVSYGPEAAERSNVEIKSILSASTTPEI